MSGNIANGRPLRVVVCGTNFGRFYVRAIQALEPAFSLVGILSRGSPSSLAYADRCGAPTYQSVDALPEDVDIACVVVGSALSGGAGTDLALALLGRGVNVLQEHPVHHDELVKCLQAARRAGVQYQLNSHYPHVEPVRRFIAATRALRRQQLPLFIDAASPIHVLYPLIDILGHAFEGLRPWGFADPQDVPPELRSLAGGPGPLRSTCGVVAGIPLTLRVHNQLHPSDRDNHALFWHRISVGTDGGVLTLADTHGPLLWSPRFHAHRDGDHRLVIDGPGTEHLALPSTSTVGTTERKTFADIMATTWPHAIGRALRQLAAAIAAGDDPLRRGQRDLTVCQIFGDITSRLGPPDIIRPAAPRPLPVESLTLRADSAHDDYSATAEFFDLAAADHVDAITPAVVAALGNVDTGHGPIVDIGAGTGLLTEAIALALPDADVLAAEPSATMRAVLTSRVFSDLRLRPRVTVTPEPAQDLELPDRISAAVVCGVAGHLDVPERTRLWRQLAERLPPGGRILVELMGFAVPTTMASTQLAHCTVGRQSYEWWCSCEASGVDRMELRTTWRVYDGGALVRQVDHGHRWFPFTLEQLVEESGLQLAAVEATSGRVSTPLGVLVA